MSPTILPEGRAPEEGPLVIHCQHPDVDAIDAAVMADDRRWFQKHPRRRVRIRPVVEGEYLIDALAGIYGRRLMIAPQSTPLSACGYVAVVDVTEKLLGQRRGREGDGVRIRIPVGVDVRDTRLRKAVIELALQGAEVMARYATPKHCEAVITFPDEAA